MTIAITQPPERFVQPSTSGATYTVRGKKASEIEYYVALALDKLEIPYLFQVDYLGGRTLRGGFVLDFLAFTPPTPTAIWVHGEYWHKGKQRAVDFFQQAEIRNLLKGKVVIVELFGKDLVDEDTTYQVVKRELRV